MTTRSLVVNCSTFSIGSAGQITADGIVQFGSGAGRGASQYFGGAGHGGSGGSPGGTPFGGYAYDSFRAPVSSGSQGANAGSNSGGLGGGYIKISATSSMSISGRITAHGAQGVNGAGGGSGGSILLETPNMVCNGNGYFGARGGNSLDPYGGAGAGGRIAIYAPTVMCSADAFGGLGSSATTGAGGPGTVYMETQTGSELTVDGGGRTRDSDLIGDFSSTAGSVAWITDDDAGAILNFDRIVILDNGALAIKFASPTLTVGELTGETSGLLHMLSGQLQFLENNVDILASITLYETATINAPNTVVIEDGAVLTSRATATLQFNVLNVKIGGIKIQIPTAVLDITGAVTVGLNAKIDAGVLRVGASGSLASSANFAGRVYCNTLEVFAESVTIDAASQVLVTNTLDSGPGAGQYTSMRSGGGAHGGSGGANGAGVTVAAYGSAVVPTTRGSRGGGFADAGGLGGGTVIIDCESLVLNGKISVDGKIGDTPNSSGGSGGSILIKADNFTGSGTATANGGDATTDFAGGGGGGRISVSASGMNTSAVTYLAFGGQGTNPGGPGTVYLQDALTSFVSLRVSARNSSVTSSVGNMADTFGAVAWITSSDTIPSKINQIFTSGNASLAFDKIGLNVSVARLQGDGTGWLHVRETQTLMFSGSTSTGGIIIPISTNVRVYAQASIFVPSSITLSATIFVAQFGTFNPNLLSVLQLNSGAMLMHPDLSLTIMSGLVTQSDSTLTISTLAVNPTATTASINGSLTCSVMLIQAFTATFGINAVVRVSSQSPGTGIATVADGVSGGGGHGGDGGGGAKGGRAFGSFVDPSVPGGLGGNGQAAGGVISVQTSGGDVIVDGKLYADGTNGVAGEGAGAGGSIYITTGTALLGKGRISARGGNASVTGYATLGESGAGGRIALHYARSSFSTQLWANGGSGGNTSAGAGTIYLNDRTLNFSTLIVDNRNTGSGGNTWIIMDRNVTINLLIVKQSMLQVFSVANFEDLHINSITGDSSGSLMIRSGQKLYLQSNLLGANLLVLPNATVIFAPEPLTIQPTVSMNVAGSICGVQDILVYGTLSLGSSGSTACPTTNSVLPPPGVYNFAHVQVWNGTFLGGNPSPMVNAVVCKTDTGTVRTDQLQLNQSVLPSTDPQCVFTPVTTSTTGMSTTTTGPIGPPTCGPGFYNNGTSCFKIDVCGTNNGGCSYMVTCTNLGNGSRTCGSCPRGTNGTGDTSCQPLCGDTYCDSTIGENCVSCPKDCNASTCDVCGDNFCDSKANEDCKSCFADCGACVQPTCLANCNRQGTCVNGLCLCNDNWGGPSCSIPKNQPINTTLSETNPVVGVVPSTPANIIDSNPTQQTKFSILIKRIAEKNSTGEIRSVQISNALFSRVPSVSGPTNKTYLSNYTTQLENGAFLSVIVLQFEEEGATTYPFAGTTYSFPSHTLKFGIAIRNWPFLSLTHSLAIVMEADSEANEAKTCANTDESGSLRWLTLTVGNVSLYGQFVDRAIIDGRTRNISFLLNSADNTVSAILPHFWSFAEMDPNYSVLLGDTTYQDVCASVTDKKRKKNRVNKKVIAIVVPVVVVFVLLVGLAIVFYPRIQTWLQVHKTRVPSMAEMSSVNSERI